MSAWTSYHTALLAKKAELERSLSDRGAIQVERLSDALDQALAQSARDIEAGRINRDQEVYRKVLSALKKFELGEFGICEDCEEEIPSNRLLVVPWAALCVPCQEKQERDQPRAPRSRATPTERPTSDGRPRDFNDH